MRLIDADEYTQEINNRIEAAIKRGTNAIADIYEEKRIRAEQEVVTFCEAALTAKNMPTIEAEPIRHGEWIKHEDGACACNVCGLGLETFVEGIFYNYCPNCGAHMDKEKT